MRKEQSDFGPPVPGGRKEGTFCSHPLMPLLDTEGRNRPCGSKKQVKKLSVKKVRTWRWTVSWTASKKLRRDETTFYHDGKNKYMQLLSARV